jgi:small subunit ribosomal protein S9
MLGTGKFSVNERELMNYIKRMSLKVSVEKPLALIDMIDKFDIIVNVNGGGLSGQAGAIQLGIARALAQINDEYHLKMRQSGLLTRDDRIVERKKYGQKGARKRFQFSKR